MIEHLLEDEKFVNPIKDSLKIFLKNMKDPKYKREKGKIDNTFEKNLDSNRKEIMEENEKFKHQSQHVSGYIIVKEDSFHVLSKIENSEEVFKLKENIKEKELIIFELEKLILDIMSYNKVGEKYFIIFRKLSKFWIMSLILITRHYILNVQFLGRKWKILLFLWKGIRNIL